MLSLVLSACATTSSPDTVELSRYCTQECRNLRKELARASKRGFEYSEGYGKPAVVGVVGGALALALVEKLRGGNSKRIRNAALAGAIAGAAIGAGVGKVNEIKSKEDLVDFSIAMNKGFEEEFSNLNKASPNASKLTGLHLSTFQEIAQSVPALNEERQAEYLELQQLIDSEVSMYSNLLSSIEKRMPDYIEAIDQIRRRNVDVPPEFISAEAALNRLKDEVEEGKAILIEKIQLLSSVDEAAGCTSGLNDNDDDTQDPGPGCRSVS